jgi:hypothetical protein
MSTEHIVALLTAERDRLNKAITPPCGTSTTPAKTPRQATRKKASTLRQRRPNHQHQHSAAGDGEDERPKDAPASQQHKRTLGSNKKEVRPISNP